MYIAIEGCCHGDMNKIYDTLLFLEEQNSVKVDLLLICGDFQAIRNPHDLDSLSVPPKYKQMVSRRIYLAL